MSASGRVAGGRTHRLSVIATLVFAVVLGTIGAGAVSASSTVSAPTCAGQTGPTIPLFTQSRSIVVDGRTRTFVVSTPTPTPPAGTAIPILFALHGTGGTGLGFEADTHFAQKAVARGYAVVEPDAVVQPGATTAWTVPSQGSTPDDFKFFDAIITNIGDVACADTDRIYVSGHSSGGAMAAFAACRWLTVAAVGSLEGVSLINPAKCSTRRVPMLVTHGTADEFVPYDGAGYLPDPNLPDLASYTGSVETDVAYWAKTINGCTAYTDSVPAANAANTEQLVKRTYSGCIADTVLYKVIGGKHHVFKTPADPVDAVTEVLDFFDAHSRIDGPAYKPPPPPKINFPTLMPTSPPTLALSPMGPVSSGSVLTVGLSGFSPSSSVAVAQCKRGKVVTGPESCALGANGVLVYPGADGRATATLTLATGVINQSGDICGPSDPCVVVAVNIGRRCETNASPLDFAGGPAQLPLEPAYPGCPTLTMSKDRASPGDVLTVTGSAFPPDTAILLGAYYSWPAAGMPSGASVSLTTSPTGTLSTTFIAPSLATGLGAFLGTTPGGQLLTVANFRSPPNVGPVSQVVSRITLAAGASLVRRGVSARVSGVLRTAAGAPLKFQRVVLQHHGVGGSRWLYLTSTRSDIRGAFSVWIRPGSHTDYRAVFAGSGSVLGSASRTILVLVRAAVSLRLSGSSVRLGRVVVFSGSVAPHRGAGERVWLQFFYSGRWNTWRPIALNSASRFSFAWRTSTGVDLSWRVVVLANSTSATAVSRAIRLTVV